MSITTRTKKVVNGTRDVVHGTIEAGRTTKEAVVKTGQATNRGYHRTGSLLMWLANTVPLAAVGVELINIASRTVKYVDFFPTIPVDFVPNVIESGNDHAVSMLDSSNVFSQLGGVLVGAESTAAHLADMAGAPGELAGGFIGGFWDGEEPGADIGGGVTEALAGAGAGVAAWKLGRAAIHKWPDRPMAAPGGH